MSDMNGQSADPATSGVRAASGIAAMCAATSGIARLARLAREYWWLLRGQLHQLRLQWFWYVVMMSFGPLVTMAFLWSFTGGSPEALLFIITGSITTALCTSAMLTLGQNIGYMKDSGSFEYYAGFPISKPVFILALATRSVILSIPSSVILLSTGAFIFGVPMRPSPVTIIIFILAGYSLAGLGAFVGFFSRDGQTAGLVTQIIDPLIVFLAPVYIPVERLPRFLQYTSRFIPTTYVANALRASVAGSVTSQTWLEIGLLVVWTVLTLWAASRKLAWRANE
jgi:ABC-2 type transport system permease protein